MRQWKNLAFRSVDNCRKHIYLPPPTTPRLLGPIWTRIFEEFWNGGSLPSPPLGCWSQHGRPEVCPQPVAANMANEQGQ